MTPIGLGIYKQQLLIASPLRCFDIFSFKHFLLLRTLVSETGTNTSFHLHTDTTHNMATVILDALFTGDAQTRNDAIDKYFAEDAVYRHPLVCTNVLPMNP
jgi:hypothetical protein